MPVFLEWCIDEKVSSKHFSWCIQIISSYHTFGDFVWYYIHLHLYWYSYNFMKFPKWVWTFVRDYNENVWGHFLPWNVSEMALRWGEETGHINGCGVITSSVIFIASLEFSIFVFFLPSSAWTELENVQFPEQNSHSAHSPVRRWLQKRNQIDARIFHWGGRSCLHGKSAVRLQRLFVNFQYFNDWFINGSIFCYRLSSPSFCASQFIMNIFLISEEEVECSNERCVCWCPFSLCSFDNLLESARFVSMIS